MSQIPEGLSLLRLVVEVGSFSRAADRLGVSHSTVSRRIGALESRVGFELLRRTSRSMSLTDAGRIAVECATSLDASVSSFWARIYDLREQVTGTLRVNCHVHLAADLVEPAAARFLHAHPEARLELILDDGPLRFTGEGLDLAVRVGLHAEGHLLASKLMDNEVVITASPSLIERAGAPTSPTDLTDYPTVAYRSPDFDITTWAYVRDDEIRTVSVQPRCSVGNGRALLRMVLAGVGAGYLPKIAAARYLASGELVDLFPGVELPHFDSVFVLRGSRDEVPRKVKEFEKELRSVVERGVDAPDPLGVRTPSQ